MRKFKEACGLIENININTHLQNYKNDYIGALRCLDKRILLLYVHAYQSYLWNKVVSHYILNNFPSKEYERLNYTEEYANINVPLLSFDVNLGEFETFYMDILKEEGVVLEDFILRSLPEVTPVETFRKMFVDVKDFHYNNPFVGFVLGKGSYATIVLNGLYCF